MAAEAPPCPGDLQLASRTVHRSSVHCRVSSGAGSNGSLSFHMTELAARANRLHVLTGMGGQRVEMLRSRLWVIGQKMR